MQTHKPLKVNTIPNSVYQHTICNEIVRQVCKHCYFNLILITYIFFWRIQYLGGN